MTLRLSDLIALIPPEVEPHVCAATATMSDRMGDWVYNGWAVGTEADLERYTFDVAGSVGILLSDLWLCHDGITTSRDDAIATGRGLQAVNILLNRDEDLARDVDFLPDGWSTSDMHRYARSNLGHGDVYIEGLPPGPVRVFTTMVVNLAYATLEFMLSGEPKLAPVEPRIALHARGW